MPKLLTFNFPNGDYGAGGETRTRDPNLGKVVLYQLSYTRGCKIVPAATAKYKRYYYSIGRQHTYNKVMYPCQRKNLKKIEFSIETVKNSSSIIELC